MTETSYPRNLLTYFQNDRMLNSYYWKIYIERWSPITSNFWARVALIGTITLIPFAILLKELGLVFWVLFISTGLILCFRKWRRGVYSLRECENRQQRTKEFLRLLMMTPDQISIEKIVQVVNTYPLIPSKVVQDCIDLGIIPGWYDKDRAIYYKQFPFEEKKYQTTLSSPYPNCPICLNPIEADAKPCPECFQLFHREHFLEWIKKNKRCPVCKEKIQEAKIDK
ncbi:MAG: RING finger protein [Promethearchaeota archaeon]